MKKKTIFLSHEGKDKSFASFLFQELQRRNQDAFLDVDRESLPKGERFPENIVEGIRGCKVAVFVLSKAFITKKWPMIELVEAYEHYEQHKRPLLLPLFYSVHVSEIDDKKEEWKTWEEAWSQWPDRLSPHVCGAALKFITKQNGMTKGDQIEPEFGMKVADEICRMVKPDIWGIHDMQQEEALSQAVKVEFDHQQSAAAAGPKVLGMWGEKDSGKSKLSNALCSQFFSEYDGFVDCVELTFHSQSSILKEVKTILQNLTGADWRVLDSITSLPVAINHLQNRIRGKKFFLAIDDVPNDVDCKKYLRELLVGIKHSCNNDSKVLLTARDSKVLESLLNECGCPTKPIQVPKLQEQGAIDILVSFATDFKRSWGTLNEEEKKAIRGMCQSAPIWNESSGSFSPGEAKAAGLVISGSEKVIAENPLQWHSAVEAYRSSDSNQLNQLFSDTIPRALERAFEDKAKVHQALLFILDAALYEKAMGPTLKGIWRWLGIVHDISQKSVKLLFQELKTYKLIGWDEDEEGCDEEHADIRTVFDWPGFTFPKFAKFETQKNPSKWRWFYYDGDKPKEAPQYMKLEKVRKMALVGGNFTDVIEVVCLKRSAGVVAFMMARCDKVQHVKVRSMKELQVLEIESCKELQKIKGLEEGKELLERLYLNRVPKWIPSGDGVLDLSRFKYLFSVRLIDTGMEKPPVISGCRDLCEFYIERNSNLEKLPVSWADLSNLTNVSFADNPKITYLPDLSPLAASLSSLSVRNCAALTNILTIESLTSLQYLNISGCISLDRPLPDLSKLKQNRLKEISALGLTPRTRRMWRDKGPDGKDYGLAADEDAPIAAEDAPSTSTGELAQQLMSKLKHNPLQLNIDKEISSALGLTTKLNLGIRKKRGSS